MGWWFWFWTIWMWACAGLLLLVFIGTMASLTGIDDGLGEDVGGGCGVVVICLFVMFFSSAYRTDVKHQKQLEQAQQEFAVQRKVARSQVALEGVSVEVKASRYGGQDYIVSARYFNRSPLDVSHSKLSFKVLDCAVTENELSVGVLLKIMRDDCVIIEEQLRSDLPPVPVGQARDVKYTFMLNKENNVRGVLKITIGLDSVDFAGEPTMADFSE